jgi:hypothetical protein
MSETDAKAVGYHPDHGKPALDLPLAGVSTRWLFE